MAQLNTANVQGDLFSRGFPKHHEMYYFFLIADKKEEQFRKALPQLVEKKHISSMKKVLEDWVKVDNKRDSNKKLEANAKLAEAKAAQANATAEVKDAAKKARGEADAHKKDLLQIVNALIAFSFQGLQKVGSPRVYQLKMLKQPA